MAVKEKSRLLGSLFALLMVPAVILLAGIGVFLALVVAGSLFAFFAITLTVMKWKARNGSPVFDEDTNLSRYSAGETIEGEAVVIEQHEVKKETTHA